MVKRRSRRTGRPPRGSRRAKASFAEDPPRATATACIGARAGAQVSHQIKHFAEKVAGHLDLPRYDIGAKITPADTESTTAPATPPRQLHCWSDGHNPTEPDDAVADWTGATLAVLHRRCGEELTALPDLHPLDSWHEWLEGHGTDFAQQVRQHLPTVAVALKHLGQPSPPLTAVATHRDIKADNVLLTATGPVLLDCDTAGPDTAEHELLRSAIAMGFGQQRPFARPIAAYRRAGVRPIPADPALFHGIVDGQRAPPNGSPGAPSVTVTTIPARAQAATECLARLRGAAKSLRRIPEWAGWLIGFQWFHGQQPLRALPAARSGR